ncbi:MAG TPA: Glu/Leu/Phe/Val dehydrogenase dimerization domain-containing protein [Syntrophorhabdaceae bacterium]|nr:Glu/Leu/Phe/Val dehydrogenase dimerization domain-containing protein [Syntrophorhabdaceae bacterium]
MEEMTVKTKLERYEKEPPLAVFHWNDSETEARGWVVINSLRGNSCGGGTRMRKGCTEQEVLALAKTMEIKFTVSGPPIGGAKSGIDFDPADPRKRGVLERWYRCIKPLLKEYYGTGGDMNVDSNTEVIPATRACGILDPQEGAIRGHYHPDDDQMKVKIEQMGRGVRLPVTDATLAPPGNRVFETADLVTGWGVAESVRHFYDIYGGTIKGKRAIIQGFGNVAAPAAYYLAQSGARIVGIIDKVGGIIEPQGISLDEVVHLMTARTGNFLISPGLMSYDEANQKIWSTGAEIFIPAAASRLVTQGQVDELLAHGLEVISAGANVPFADQAIFYGSIAQFADARAAVIPDFIANCGMARTFCYLQGDNVVMSDRAIFDDVSKTVRIALEKTCKRNPSRVRLTETALAVALDRM